jgi:hypothetical protein
LAELLKNDALGFGAELRKADMEAAAVHEGHPEQGIREHGDRVDRGRADLQELRDGAALRFISAVCGKRPVLAVVWVTPDEDCGIR